MGDLKPKHVPWPPATFPLVRGPQDGAIVLSMKPMPEVIWVSRGCTDGNAGWARERDSKFPHKYVMDGERFVYRNSD